MAGKHGCTGMTKRGTPCNARTLKGRDVCIAHTDKKERDATGFGVTGGRPRKLGVTEAYRARVETDAELWYAVLDEARTATRAVVVGSGEDAELVEVPDHAIRLAAFREAHDRVYGKPRQATEVSGPDGQPLGAVFVTDPQLAKDARALLRRAESASGNEPGGARASDE